MALRINLFHEVLRAKRQRQYDPLKLSVLALIIVAVGMAAYYFIQLKRTSDAKAVYNAQKSEFDRLTPQKTEAEKKEADINKQIDLAEKFTKRIEKRIYWAPLFESIMVTVPANIQLTKLSCDTGREKAGLSQMSIEGIAASLEPRAVAEELRKAVVARVAAKYPGATAAFRVLDEGTEHPVVGGRRVNTAVFTIAVNFRIEAEPPPPAAAAPVKRVAKNEGPAL
jgi:Tfp pilus assembly protein PilN